MNSSSPIRLYLGALLAAALALTLSMAQANARELSGESCFNTRDYEYDQAARGAATPELAIVALRSEVAASLLEVPRTEEPGEPYPDYFEDIAEARAQIAPQLVPDPAAPDQWVVTVDGVLAARVVLREGRSGWFVQEESVQVPQSICAALARSKTSS